MIKILFSLFFSISLYADVYALHAMSSNGHNLYHTTTSSVSADVFRTQGYFFTGQNFDTLNNAFAFSALPNNYAPPIFAPYFTGAVLSFDSSLSLDKDFYLKNTKDSLIMFFSSSVGTTSINVKPLGFCFNASGLSSKPAAFDTYLDTNNSIRYLINFTSSKIETDYSAQCFLYNSSYSQSKASTFLKTDFDANNTYFYLYRKMFPSASDLTKYNAFVAACSNNSLSCSIKNPFNLNGCKTEITNKVPDNFAIKNNFAKFIPSNQTCGQFVPSNITYKEKKYEILSMKSELGTTNCVGCVFDFTTLYLKQISLCEARLIDAKRECANLKNNVGVVVDFTCNETNGIVTSSYKCNDAYVLKDIVKNPDGSYTIAGEAGGYKDPVDGKIYTKDGKYTGFVELPDGRIVREGSPDQVFDDITEELDKEINDAIDDLEEENPFTSEALSAFMKMYNYAKSEWEVENILPKMKYYEQNDYDFTFEVVIFDRQYDLFSKTKIDMLIGGYVELFRDLLIYLAYLASILIFIRMR